MSAAGSLRGSRPGRPVTHGILEFPNPSGSGLRRTEVPAPVPGWSAKEDAKSSQFDWPGRHYGGQNRASLIGQSCAALPGWGSRRSVRWNPAGARRHPAGRQCRVPGPRSAVCVRGLWADGCEALLFYLSPVSRPAPFLVLRVTVALTKKAVAAKALRQGSAPKPRGAVAD